MLSILSKLFTASNLKSPSGKIDWTDMKELGRESALVAIAGGLAYAALNVASVDFDGKTGEGWTAIVGPIAFLVLSAASKWATGNTKKERAEEKKEEEKSDGK